MNGPSSRLGWGLVGCGWVARDYVAPALRDAENGRAVALLDTDPHALERVGAILPDAARHTDLGTFLETPGLDAVYVATPHDSHAAIVERAAEAGKHVLCEKPMATTVADAEKMVAACGGAGVLYATAFDQRFHAAHRRLRRMVADGALGTVTMIRIHYAFWCPPDWTPAGSPDDENWRVVADKAGGGALADLAPHGLDLVQTLLDEPISEVACLSQRRVFDYPVEDGAAIVARLSGGAIATIHNAFNCPDTLPRRTLEVYGTKGAAIARNTMGQTPGGTLELVSAADGSREEVEIPPEEDVSPFLAQVEAFGEAVLSGVAYPFPPERDLRTMRALEAALRSEGTPVGPAVRAGT